MTETGDIVVPVWKARALVKAAGGAAALLVVVGGLVALVATGSTIAWPLAFAVLAIAAFVATTIVEQDSKGHLSLVAMWLSASGSVSAFLDRLVSPGWVTPGRQFVVGLVGGGAIVLLFLLLTFVAETIYAREKRRHFGE